MESNFGFRVTWIKRRSESVSGKAYGDSLREKGETIYERPEGRCGLKTQWELWAVQAPPPIVFSGKPDGAIDEAGDYANVGATTATIFPLEG